MIVTNLMIYILNEDLENKESMQLQVDHFHPACYDFQSLKQSYDPENGFILVVSAWQQPKRNEYKSEYNTPFVNTDFYACWIMRTRLSPDGKLE